MASTPAPSRAEFEIEGVDVAVVNSLRRAVMSLVPTAAFDFDPTAANQGSAEADGGVKILVNTSALHNEFLGNRVSIVPLGLDENQLHAFDPRDWKCVLRAKNTGDSAGRDPSALVEVTTGGFEIYDKGGARVPQSRRDAVFPACAATKDHILLARLRPSVNGGRDGEEIHMECVPRLGVGREHTRWSPVSVCFFRNKQDAEAVERELAARLAAVAEDEDPAIVEHQFRVLDAQRFYLRDAHGAPAAFEFILESETRLRPAFIVWRAFKALHDKVTAFRDGVRVAAIHHPGAADAHAPPAAPVSAADALLQPLRGLRVTSLPNKEDTYAVTLYGEDHTLGNLLQGMLYTRWIRDGRSSEVSYIGYHQEHPLEDHIVVIVKCAAPGDDVRARLAAGGDWLAGELQALMQEWVEFTGLGAEGIVPVNEWLVRIGAAPAKAR